jgi:hypothetical protein
VASALMAKMGFAESERVEVKMECLKMIARLRLDPERAGLLSAFVETYLELNEKENETLRARIETLPDFEREVTMEFVNIWHKEGWQKGMREALQRQRELICLQIEQQTGTLSNNPSPASSGFRKSNWNSSLWRCSNLRVRAT